MGKMKKKYESGTATRYVSRAQALRKLQLSLKDFRRLCILKGIYPREPAKRKVAGRGDSSAKTYYHVKDIRFLLHEPIIGKFRQYKIFLRKLKHAKECENQQAVQRLMQKKPVYSLDHVIRERYPSFEDALRELDDCVTLCALFATLPRSKTVNVLQTRRCRRLTTEFMHYVIASRSLEKVFVSIKGVYFQARIREELVTWIMPHSRAYAHPADVDFRIMSTFVELYTTLLGFVNFRLFRTLNLRYPPRFALADEGSTQLALGTTSIDADAVTLLDPRAVNTGLVGWRDYAEELVGCLNVPLVRDQQGESQRTTETEVDTDRLLAESAAVDQATRGQEDAIGDRIREQRSFERLFASYRFFLSRETPREILTFVIRAFGGTCGWDSRLGVGSALEETDATLTHMVVDRPQVSMRLGVVYVQPQYIFDCVNARRLLDTQPYAPGARLPPHRSPFDAQAANAESQSLEEENRLTESAPSANQNRKRKAAKQKTDETRMRVETGRSDDAQPEQVKAAEEKKLREMMIPKKHQRLYRKLQFREKKTKQEQKRLVTRRQQLAALQPISE